MCHNVTFEVAVFVLYCICISTQFLPVKLSYRKCNIKYCEHGVCSELLLGIGSFVPTGWSSILLRLWTWHWYIIEWGGVVNIETFILLEVKLQLHRHYIPRKLTFGAHFYILHLRLYFLHKLCKATLRSLILKNVWLLRTHSLKPPF